MRWAFLFVIFAIMAVPNCSNAQGDNGSPNLINGEAVDVNDWRYVVRIRTGNSSCSATVVGPKAVVTAAHCGGQGAGSEFKLQGKTYKGKFYRSTLYPRRDHDVAVIVLDTAIPKEDILEFAHVDKTPIQVGDPLYLLGYGCIRPGGGGGNDGILRAGYTKVKGFSGYDVVSQVNGGAALCYGDSGGPAMADDDHETPKLRTVNSKGNIRDTNYTTNLASTASQEFLKAVAENHRVVICGVTDSAVCNDKDDDNPPPPPPPPGVDCSDEQAGLNLALSQLSAKVDELNVCLAK